MTLPQTPTKENTIVYEHGESPRCTHHGMVVMAVRFWPGHPEREGEVLHPPFFADEHLWVIPCHPGVERSAPMWSLDEVWMRGPVWPDEPRWLE